MLDELLLEISKVDLEFEDCIHLKSLKQNEDSLYLTFELVGNEGVQKIHPWWEVQCHNPRSLNINDRYFYDFAVFDDHGFLWEYNQPVFELYFRGKPEDARSVIGALYLEHVHLAGDFIPFGEYFNKLVALERLLNAGFGLLSEGPEIMMRAYAKVLDRYNMSPNLLLRGSPKHWSHTRQWILDNSKYYVLSFGKSYVLAANFACKKISKSSFRE
ncbi:hypothetical protein CEB3_c26920 [Peptococcaceae bacterium CEB3]|nr:hypothetical protein CEB3_c26920 [Peptococcaceae bacterium CEB3]